MSELRGQWGPECYTVVRCCSLWIKTLHLVLPNIRTIGPNHRVLNGFTCSFLSFCLLLVLLLASFPLLPVTLFFEGILFVFVFLRKLYSAFKIYVVNRDIISIRYVNIDWCADMMSFPFGRHTLNSWLLVLLSQQMNEVRIVRIHR